MYCFKFSGQITDFQFRVSSILAKIKNKKKNTKTKKSILYKKQKRKTRRQHYSMTILAQIRRSLIH